MNETVEASASEVLHQQHLLRRRSQSGTYHYDQLNIYYDESGGEFISRWFTGRSRNTMKLRGSACYALETLVDDRVRNFIHEGEANGYEYVDRMVTNFADIPFSKFAGARLSPVSLFKLNKTPEWTDPLHTVFIPYCHGEHVCIRIGMQDAFSVQCMNDRGEIIQLKEKDQNRLRGMVRLQKYETFVIEAILTPHDITFLDLLCVNGVGLTWPYRKRMALLAKLRKDPNILSRILSPKNIDVFAPNMAERVNPQKRPISGYAVKSLKAPVNLNDVVITPVIEQHFILRVYPSQLRDKEERELRLKGMQKIALSMPNAQDQGWTQVSTLFASLGYEPFQLVKCDGIKNGKLINPKPLYDQEMADYLREEDASTLDHLDRNWALTLKHELSCN